MNGHAVFHVSLLWKDDNALPGQGEAHGIIKSVASKSVPLVDQAVSMIEDDEDELFIPERVHSSGKERFQIFDSMEARD